MGNLPTFKLHSIRDIEKSIKLYVQNYSASIPLAAIRMKDLFQTLPDAIRRFNYTFIRASHGYIFLNSADRSPR